MSTKDGNLISLIWIPKCSGFLKSTDFPEFTQLRKGKRKDRQIRSNGEKTEKEKK
jgi:hypothetical protein